MPAMNRVPSGGTLYQLPNGALYLVYDAAGMKVAYTVASAQERDQTEFGTAATTITQEQFNALLGQRWVLGGDVVELWPWAAANPSKTWHQQVESMLLTYTMGNRTVLSDPQIYQIYMELVAGNISPEEAQSRIRQTNYWQGRTQQQNQWNDLSHAEQEQQVSEWTKTLNDLWFQYVGESLPYNDPTLRDYATKVASGALGQGQVVEEWIRPAALKNTESPWSRTLRNEQESERQRPVDISNKTVEVQQLAEQWGIRIDSASAKRYAQQLVEKTLSDGDLLAMFKQQSQVLYPAKPPEMDAQTYAAPWMQTFSRVLERPADLWDPSIQAALQQGVMPFQFEQQLKQRPEWLQTKNGWDDVTSAFAGAARLMGWE